MASQLRTLADAVTAALDVAFAWDSPVTVGWFLDRERQDLQTLGLTAIVIPRRRITEQFTRGGPLRRPGLTVSVFRAHSAAVGSEPYDNGDTVAERAEDVADYLFNRVVNGQSCVEIDHSDVISETAAKQYRLWLSVMQTNWR